MSAWIVAKEHIDAMLRLYWQHVMEHDRNQRDELRRIGQLWVDENVYQVGYRYPGDELRKRPTDADDSYWLRPFEPNLEGPMPTAIDGFSIVGCYRYQCWEDTEHFESSEANRLAAQLREALLQAMPERLRRMVWSPRLQEHLLAVYDSPEYAAAPWGWNASVERERSVANAVSHRHD